MCELSAHTGTAVGYYRKGDYVFGGKCGPSKVAAQRYRAEIEAACHNPAAPARVIVIGEAWPFWKQTFPYAEFVDGAVDTTGATEVAIRHVPFPAYLREPPVKHVDHPTQQLALTA